ncbi:MAG: MBL fold metallo-hydrolase [Sphaerochaetaceae bacterium]|nr:MBL fold metallo-hydrolase [Spirochaetales bacterium]
MRIESMQVGPYGTNCYILIAETGVWIIDPGFDGQRIVHRVEQLGLMLKGVLLTHTHWDHVMGLPDLVTRYNDLRIYVHQQDAQWLGSTGRKMMADLVEDIDPLNAPRFLPYIKRLPEATDVLEDQGQIDCTEEYVSVIHTPGHTIGSVCYYLAEQKTLFSGDTLFFQSIGRTDVPTGNHSSIIHSITERLLTLPHDTTVLAGHGRPTTIERELQNPWLGPRVL